MRAWCVVLLEAVEQTGSMHAAAAQHGVLFRVAWRKIQAMEDGLGVFVTQRSTGLEAAYAAVSGGGGMGRWCAALYDTAMAPLERSRFHAIRKPLLGQARGTVLEIGAGTGVNFPYYTAAAHVIAVEPDPCMVARSFPRATQAAVPITVLRARAEALPFPDHTFDTVVGTLVFCTIPDPRQALSELQRISKPAGTALFFEHVRVHRPLVGRLQEWLTPLWKRIAGGCHLNRNTLALITQTGFEVTCLQSHYQELFLVIEAKAVVPS